jgi:predicted DNA-binding antitoxin AbrB/MazE fold protein
MELGPTKPADLKPGEKIKVTLIATSEGFKWWTAHPEVGESEHGEGERDGEHTGEGEGEHE